MTVNSANYHPLYGIIQNEPKIEEIGGKRDIFSHFFGRRVYLSHNQDGWSLKKLNIFQRIFRSFSFYKSTHLSTISKALESDDKQNRLYTNGNNKKFTTLIEKIEILWNKHRKISFPSLENFNAHVRFNDPEYLTKLQNQNDIQHLWVDVNPPLAKPVSIDEDQKEKYLEEISSPSHQQLMKKVIDHHITHISMVQFLSALKECVVELNDRLKDLPETSKITLVTVPQKSQKWVGCLALRYMNRYPNKHVQLVQKAGSLQGFSHLVNGQQDIVIFDDCSYSGTQLCEELQSLISDPNWRYKLNMINKDPQKKLPTEEKKQNIYFVVPYMTSKAKERFEETKIMIGKLIPHVEIQLITRHEIPTIDELPLTESDIEKLKDLRIYSDHMTFSYMDWKKPDFMSMPCFFADGLLPEEYRKSKEVKLFRFIPEITKPYHNF